jgi:hypothetical protein
MKSAWHDLNVLLSMRTEDQVKTMLDEEVKVHKRPTYLVRIHQRYTTLRAQRERKELLERIND